MDKVVHFEIPADDTARAREFYGSVFEWNLQPMQGYDYTMALTTPVDQKTQMPTEPGAINGGIRQRSAETPTPVIVVSVDSIDQSLKKVESEVLIDELFAEIDKWIADGMNRPKRLKMAKPAALAMAEASAIPLE